MADQKLAILVEVINGQASATQLEGVAGATGNVGKQADESAKKTSGLMRSMKALAAGFAVYKGYQFIKSSVTETTSLAKSTAALTRLTGLDTASAAGWVTTAKERGIQSKQLNQAFISLSRSISSGAQGSKASVQAFQQLGLSAANLKVQDAHTQMSMLADSFKALPPGVDKAALAQKLFGRQAQAMLPLLNQGSAALNKQIDEMGKSSGVTNASQKSALALVKQQRALEQAMLGVKVAIGTALIPILTAASSAIRPLASGFAQLMQHSAAFRVAIYALVGALTTWLILSKALAISGLALNAAWLLIPTAIVAIGIALVMLYNKCAWFRNAVNAVFNTVKQVAVAAFGVIKSVGAVMFAPAIGAVKTFMAVAKVAIAGAKAAFQSLPAVINAITGAIKAVASVVSGVFTTAWNGAKTAVQGVATAVNAVVSAARAVTSLPGKGIGFLKSLSPFQSGGMVAPGGQLALVGEAGPEVVALPGRSQVIPNHQLGAAGGSSEIHTHVYLNDREIAHAMGDYVAGQQARR